MDKQNDSILENFGNLLVIDIETVAQFPDFEDIPSGLKDHWERKASFIINNLDSISDAQILYKDKAGIYAEYGKIVCIGIGYYKFVSLDTYEFRMKYLVDNDEKQLLTSFINVLQHFSPKNQPVQFCGHNIKEFDIPYICRRMLINGITLPPYLQLSGKKPWEIKHYDTLELWKFGDYKHYVALDVLAQIFNIPSPKSDIAGKDVNQVYWAAKDLKRIGDYCLQDVYTTAQVFLKITGHQQIKLLPIYNNNETE